MRQLNIHLKHRALLINKLLQNKRLNREARRRRVAILQARLIHYFWQLDYQILPVKNHT